jgi:hypothetical protein
MTVTEALIVFLLIAVVLLGTLVVAMPRPIKVPHTHVGKPVARMRRHRRPRRR